MKLVRTIALTLGLSFATGGALAGSALADDGDQRQQRWDDDNGRDDRDDRNDRKDRYDDNGRQDRHDDHGDEAHAFCEHDAEDSGRWDRPGRWGRFVPVRFVNHRDQWVTLYLNGAYLGRVAPNSRDRIALPPGSHVVTYKVGHRNRFHQVSVNAFPGQRSRVVIEGRRGGGRWMVGWGGGWGGGW